MDTTALPVAVVGGGPVGLAAAAHLLERGLEPLVLEAGTEIGAAVREWGHVRVFSPWRYLVDDAARRLLQRAGWETPDPEGYPTGAELVAAYLEPLAAQPAVAKALQLDARVSAVTRLGYDRLRGDGREQAPFELHLADGRRLLARAVIDASGTWSQPNYLGAGAVPLPGETEAAAQIRYGHPDVLGAERARYAGKRTLVVGAGHSAFGAVLDLATLAEEEPGTAVTWAVRRGGLQLGGGDADALPARGALGQRVGRVVATGRVQVVTGLWPQRLDTTPEGLVLHGREVDGGAPVAGPVDEIVVATGYRPDSTVLGELRVALDPWVEAPVALADLIDPNVHSCGTVRPHGARELAHPERDLYIVGMKSYGRAPTFLLLTGYEQVRSVVAAIDGDTDAAENVALVLPESGVCGLPVLTAAGESTSACCG